MLPTGYKSLLMCDTRRAEQWRAGLERAGFKVTVVEADSEKASCEVGVRASHEMAAKAFVTEVIQGRSKLPTPPFLTATAFKALVAIGLVLVGLFVAGWVGWLR